MSTLYLLDTGILVQLIRGGDIGRRIASEYKLLADPTRAIISIVSHGELLVLVDKFGWGPKGVQAARSLLTEVPTVDISRPEVIAAYVKVSAAARTAGTRGRSR